MFMCNVFFTLIVYFLTHIDWMPGFNLVFAPIFSFWCLLYDRNTLWLFTETDYSHFVKIFGPCHSKVGLTWCLYVCPTTLNFYIFSGLHLKPPSYNAKSLLNCVHARPCTYAFYPSLIPALRAWWPTRLYPHQKAPYAPFSCLVLFPLEGKVPMFWVCAQIKHSPPPLSPLFYFTI